MDRVSFEGRDVGGDRRDDNAWMDQGGKDSFLAMSANISIAALT